MADSFDAVVIGAGPGGEACAGDLADGGMKVATVERELVGGECGFWACVPSKTLLRPPEARTEAERAPGAREAVTGAVDVASALAWRDYMVSDYDDSHQAKWLEDKDIEIVRGQGRIEGPGRVSVDGRVLETDRIVIATGSDPAVPPIDELDRIGYWTNREATGVKEIPERLLVLGGGPVGVEMGQALRRFGASVAIVEGQDRLISREARGASAALAEALSAEGIELRFGSHAKQVAQQGDGVSLTLDDGDELRGDKLLVATGRKPRLDGLGLENAGIAPGERGIEVDERLRAGEGIWAIGDVTGVLLFTHVAKYQARVAAADMLGGEVRADYRAVPRVVFTDPQIAAAGLHEDQARDAGCDVATATVELSKVTRTQTYMRNYEEAPGFLTLVADRRRGVLLGAYAAGPEAGEWIQQATLAIRADVPTRVLRDTIQPFPTFSEAFVTALKNLAGQGYGL
jgi:pyruvate/2-oxoglutarate dehydrogenase complex dihydrolipoamide dehydrogenase (E3) component